MIATRAVEEGVHERLWEAIKNVEWFVEHSPGAHPAKPAIEGEDEFWVLESSAIYEDASLPHPLAGLPQIVVIYRFDAVSVEIWDMRIE